MNAKTILLTLILLLTFQQGGQAVDIKYCDMCKKEIAGETKKIMSDLSQMKGVGNGYAER